MSEAFNSNSLNVLAGIAIPALVVSLGPATGLVVFSVWWLLGMTAVAVACLTVYDMAKAVDSGMEVTEVRLVEKTKEPA